MGVNKPTAPRFFRFVSPEPNTGCWIWTGFLNGGGYGTFSLRGHNELAHRVSWAIHYGDPMSLYVCHRCDNPWCVNPDHLFLGDQSDNMLDCARKGRWMAGKWPDASPETEAYKDAWLRNH